MHTSTYLRIAKLFCLLEQLVWRHVRLLGAMIQCLKEHIGTFQGFASLFKIVVVGDLDAHQLAHSVGPRDEVVHLVKRDKYVPSLVSYYKGEIL